MKRFLTLSLVAIMLCAFIIPISAANYDDEVMPCYNNTMKATADFQIANNGLATITLDYIGFPNYATGATITSNVQKLTSNGWEDVDNASWVDVTQGFTATVQHTVQLTSNGTYRLVFEFEIRGTAGAADVISDTIEDKY